MVRVRVRVRVLVRAYRRAWGKCDDVLIRVTNTHSLLKVRGG